MAATRFETHTTDVFSEVDVVFAVVPPDGCTKEEKLHNPARTVPPATQPVSCVVQADQTALFLCADLVDQNTENKTKRTQVSVLKL